MECGLQHMNKHIFYLTFIVTILLTGCADMGTETPTEETVAAKISEDNAETLPLKLPEWMPIYHDNSETSTDERILEYVYSGYYAYNGRRYWVDIEGGTGCFIEENGSYSSVPDQFGEVMPEDQLFGINKIMYYYNAEEYLYLGCSETEDDYPEYYVHNNGKYMLRIHVGDDLYDKYYIPPEMLGEGRTLVEISLLVASKI